MRPTLLADHVDCPEARLLLASERLRIAGAVMALFAAGLLVAAGLLWRERRHPRPPIPTAAAQVAGPAAPGGPLAG